MISKPSSILATMALNALEMALRLHAAANRAELVAIALNDIQSHAELQSRCHACTCGKKPTSRPRSRSRTRQHEPGGPPARRQSHHALQSHRHPGAGKAESPRNRTRQRTDGSLRMYLEHFGLNEPPFRITPHTDFFFDGANRGATLDALVYAITHDEGIVKVSGEVGSGKTMLCRVLMERLPETVTIVYLANPSLSRDDILYAIADELQSRQWPRIHAPPMVMRALQDRVDQILWRRPSGGGAD
jgi:hypothetical protein